MDERKKYESKYQAQMDDIWGKLQNRKPFEYDAQNDALYQAAVDNYIQMGNRAMQDTMGQAANLTGGYGNSYVQQAGQQAYQGYLQQANAQMPEYYKLAADAYGRQGDDLMRQYGMLADADRQDYGRFMDQQNQDNWYLQFQHQQEQDKAAQDRWREEFEYGKDRDKLADERWQMQWDEAHKPHGGGGGGGPYGPGEEEGQSTWPDWESKLSGVTTQAQLDSIFSQILADPNIGVDPNYLHAVYAQIQSGLGNKPGNKPGKPHGGNNSKPWGPDNRFN